MTSALHSEQTDCIHIPYAWSYADAAARAAGTGFVGADVGKLARQLDNNTLWMLTAITPTWLQIGGAGLNAGTLDGLDSLAFVKADGSVIGATGAPQDFGANGIKADLIAESTGAAGVTIDGVVLKDFIVSASSGIVTKQSVADVANPPSDAELDSAFGAPATLGRGFVATIDDNDDDTLSWLVWTTDASWYYVLGTKAV